MNDINNTINVRDFFEVISKNKQTYVACTVNLVAIKNVSQKNAYMKIFCNFLQDLTITHNAALYQFYQSGLILIIETNSQGMLERQYHQIINILGPDKTLLQETSTTKIQEIVSIYNLETSFNRFVEICRHLNNSAVKLKQDSKQSAPIFSKCLKPLKSSELEKIDDFLQSVNLSSFIIKKNIYSCEDGRVKDLFGVVYSVNAEKLLRTMLPKTDVSNYKYLYMHLSTLVDARFMKILSTSLKTFNAKIAIKINIENLFSIHFLQFKTSLNFIKKENIIIMFDILDALNNLDNYKHACSYLRKDGYIVCVSGLNFDILGYVQAEYLDSDLMLLNLPDNIKPNNDDENFDILNGIIGEFGNSRLILANCKDQDSANSSIIAGGKLVSGTAIDSLSNDNK